MAAVTKNNPRACAPTAYEFNDRGTATEAIAVGDLVKITATGIAKVAAGAVDAHGIALIPAIAGGHIEYGVQGEMDGFVLPGGVNPGDPLYPSASVAGGMDSTATTLAATTPPVPGAVRIRAVTTTRIRYNFV